MAIKQNRLKKRVLQEAFDANLESIQGQPEGSLRRQRMRRKAVLKRTIVLTAFVVLGSLMFTAWRGYRAATAAALEETHLREIASRTVINSGNNGDQLSDADRLKRVAGMLKLHGSQTLVPEVIPLAVKLVAIDAGHGGKDSGTALGYGLREKDITLDIATRLGSILTESGYQVLHTRTEDISISLKERAEVANKKQVDLFISIHVNWLPRREARGVETYYLGQTDDPFIRQLATSENQDSGFSVSDYRRLLEGILADVRQDESRKLARSIQKNLYEILRSENSRIQNRGVMTAPFVVLTATEMPAILAEVACLSNDREARLLAIPRYRQKIAQALYVGISEYADSVNRSGIDSEKGT